MAQTNSRFFSVMVIGEDPKSIMDKYDINKKVEPYVKYKFTKAEDYQKTAIKVSRKLLNDADLTMMSPEVRNALEASLKRIESLSTFDYYRQLTDGMYYDENGNALSEKNPNGKWVTAHIGRNFSLPLILSNGSESYQARVSEINWNEMHLKNQDTYETAWELIMENKKPSNEIEKQIAKSMKGKENYFESFQTKEKYVLTSTAYWNYAYVDENGWQSIDDSNHIDWITSFYDKFVKNLKPDDLVTIYECTINDDI